MVGHAPRPVNTRGSRRRHACQLPGPVARFARSHHRRRSSGVERALGKGEARGSIPRGGTIEINGLVNIHAAVIGGVFVWGHTGGTVREHLQSNRSTACHADFGATGT